MAVSPEAARRLVLVNGIHSKSGGGKVYLEQVVPRLCALGDGVAYAVIARPDQRALLEKRGCETIVVRAPSGAMGSFLWDQTVLPWMAARRRADLVFNLASYGPWVLGRRSMIILRSTSEAGASSSGLFLKLYWPIFDMATRISIRTSGGGQVVSESFRDRIVERFRVPAASLDVVPHGVGPQFAPDPEPGEDERLPPRPYVIAVSDLYPHKNLTTVLDAFARVAASRRDLRLVLAGRPLDSGVSGALRRRSASPDLADRVVFLDWVAPRDLPALYRGASAAIFLSLAETFGIPQVEAMACGTPLIASDLPFARDVSGSAALLVPPRDAEAVARALAKVLDDRDVAADLRRRGVDRATLFTQDATARRSHEAILRRLASLAPRGRIARET